MPINPYHWLEVTEWGLWIKPADLYLDPQRAVERSVVSHGHADHARPGSGTVWATRETLEIMSVRYGDQAAREPVAMEYGAEWDIGSVVFRLEPAGHIRGSAQVVMEYQGERVVYSGDYKRKEDPTCDPFRVVGCDLFITEATFGLPVFKHPAAPGEVDRLLQSMRRQPERTHVVGVYALGKCQRLIALLRASGYTESIFVHGALLPLCRWYQEQGVELGDVLPATVEAKKRLKGALVLGPPSAIREPWARRLHDPVVGYASGWMSVRQRVRQRHAELPLRISDHADWEDLLRTIEETGCREVWVTHGQEDALVYECGRRGLKALPLALAGWDGEEEE
ncbi:MAG: ligase-associated DNA damage response exonuclease [Candidatus Methylacidiphilales bacterium]